ncbi:ABC transporter substrate-binding protein [Teichococcus aestuarii]|uniref:ABC transporter substrate-binding protein n=1 Tax=Teichococcus aestuarii TaxID=568898 RepID=UPI00360AE447
MLSRLHTVAAAPLRASLLAAGALAALLSPAAAQAPAREATLRVVLSNELTSIDPVLSTAAFVRNHGFMVYDQLFAVDGKGIARPQMVESHSVSADAMTHRFTLRPGLAFHDGAPVRAADAVASIRRWGQRDVVGKALAASTASLEVIDERSFELKLSRPFGPVTDALARSTASALFVMPERVANTPATTAITDATGSGPFIMDRENWRIGDRAVYRRNPAYTPRAEPADGLAGGKVVKVERLEWLAMPDASVAASALSNGEIDFVEHPAPDLLPLLQKARGVTVGLINPVGSMVWLRINHTQPPFDNPKARQALLHAIDQKEVLQGLGIPAEDQVPYCPAYFMCGTPLESTAGAAGLRDPDLGRARTLLREAGYDNRPVVFLNGADNPLNNGSTLVLAEQFKRAGMNMDVQTLDWATVTVRRNRREAPAQGGWNLFVTIANALDAGSPLSNLYLASPCEGGLTGWPCDAKLEELRRAWWEEPDAAKRRALLDAVHARAYEVLPYINAGQFRTRSAWRSNLTGVLPATVPVFWNVERK